MVNGLVDALHKSGGDVVGHRNVRVDVVLENLAQNRDVLFVHQVFQSRVSEQRVLYEFPKIKIITRRSGSGMSGLCPSLRSAPG